MRHTLVAPLLAALAHCCASLASAQRPAVTVDASRLPIGVDSLEIYLVSGGTERRVGRLWDELQRVEIGGASVLRRVYRTENSAFGPTLDSTYSVFPSLRPYAHKSEARASAVEVVYRADSVVGQRSVSLGKVAPVARRLASSITDAATFDLQIRASPLAAGYRLVSTAYLAATDSVATLSAVVTGKERWRSTIASQTVDVWVVQMNFAGLASTLWIDAQTRAMIRQTIRLTPAISIMMSRPGIERVRS